MVIDPGGEVNKIIENARYITSKTKIYIHNSLPWRPYWSISRIKKRKKAEKY